MTTFSDDEKRRLYAADLAAQLAPVDSLSLFEARHLASAASDGVEALVGIDVETYLPDDLLVKMDIASMACSLEVRSPLLDHHLVEFAARLPVSLKLRGRRQKHLLRRAVSELLPRSTLERRKMGFGVPLDRWFRTELRDMAYDVLLDRVAGERGYFRPNVVREYLDSHVRRRANHQMRLWNLLMLELWHRMFIDRRCPVQSGDAPPLLPLVSPPR
jgi:asparagine synthase (glutamine-hydrolysing)